MVYRGKEMCQCKVGWYYRDWSDFELHIIVPGDNAVLKNSRRLYVYAMTVDGKSPNSCPRCRTRLRPSLTSVPSARAEKALDLMANEMRDIWIDAKLDTIPMPIMVNASIVTYAKTKRRADASNLYQLPEDAMERAGIIEDDWQIASHDGSRRLCDRGNPRVEITLSPARVIAWSPMPPPKDDKKREM